MTTPQSVNKALVTSDLAKLTPEERNAYVNEVCASLNLNPLTKPFAFLKNRSGELVLYALKDCTEQLRTVHAISVKILAREVIEGVYVVTAQASRPDGRADESTGAVAIEGKKGDDRANAMMKAETKAKRRVTLSICGLGMLDESEVETIKGATVVDAEPPGTQRNTPAEQAELAERRIQETQGDGSKAAGGSPASHVTSPTPPAAEVPGPLKLFFSAIDEGRKGAVREGFDLLKKQLVEAMPDNGERAYQDILKRHGIEHGKTMTPEAVKACWLALWEMGEFARNANQKPPVVTNADVPFEPEPEQATLEGVK